MICVYPMTNMDHTFLFKHYMHLSGISVIHTSQFSKSQNITEKAHRNFFLFIYLQQMFLHSKAVLTYTDVYCGFQFHYEILVYICLFSKKLFFSNIN